MARPPTTSAARARNSRRSMPPWQYSSYRSKTRWSICSWVTGSCMFMASYPPAGSSRKLVEGGGDAGGVFRQGGRRRVDVVEACAIVPEDLAADVGAER